MEVVKDQGSKTDTHHSDSVAPSNKEEKHATDEKENSDSSSELEEGQVEAEPTPQGTQISKKAVDNERLTTPKRVIRPLLHADEIQRQYDDVFKKVTSSVHPRPVENRFLKGVRGDKWDLKHLKS